MKAIVVRQFDDMHCHFRTGLLMQEVLPFTARYCKRAVAMPNTRPKAILTGEDALWYGRAMDVCLGGRNLLHFKPLLTIEIRDQTTPKIIQEAREAGVVAGKVYPLGVTTNSDEGLRDFFSKGILETFRAMQDCGMLLLLHGELDHPLVLVTGREKMFLTAVFPRLVGMFPDLKIVLEHLSTRAAVEAVLCAGPNVAATITAHHLCTTLNDVVGDGIRPHNMCMPIPKGFDDRDALLKAATSGSPKFFLGSDSAPHVRENKECAKGACGVFSAPILPELLAQIFEGADKLDKLEDFTSRFGAQFYGLRQNIGTITLVKQKWTVPQQYGSVVPFMAGQTLQWQLA